MRSFIIRYSASIFQQQERYKGFSLKREHLRELRHLKSNKEIIITRPDKGRATVIMNREDYLAKTYTILDDRSKFEKLGPTDTHDHTAKIENKISEFLDTLVKKGQLKPEEAARLKPLGSTRPRLYSLPKIHKKDVPVRPILSMSGSPQYRVSRWLADLLQPVSDKYSRHCVRDSFAFVGDLREHSFPSNYVMCSYDVVSLFTNVHCQRPLIFVAKRCILVIVQDLISAKSHFVNLCLWLRPGLSFHSATVCIVRLMV